MQEWGLGRWALSLESSESLSAEVSQGQSLQVSFNECVGWVDFQMAAQSLNWSGDLPGCVLVTGLSEFRRWPEGRTR